MLLHVATTWMWLARSWTARSRDGSAVKTSTSRTGSSADAIRACDYNEFRRMFEAWCGRRYPGASQADIDDALQRALVRVFVNNEAHPAQSERQAVLARAKWEFKGLRRRDARLRDHDSEFGVAWQTVSAPETPFDTAWVSQVQRMFCRAFKDARRGMSADELAGFFAAYFSEPPLPGRVDDVQKSDDAKRQDRARACRKLVKAMPSELHEFADGLPRRMLARGLFDDIDEADETRSP